jgi:hypothetical protein
MIAYIIGGFCLMCSSICYIGASFGTSMNDKFKGHCLATAFLALAVICFK